MEDQFFLMYCRNNIAYPVALNAEQQEAFKFALNLIPQPYRVVFDKPQGEVIDMKKE